MSLKRYTFKTLFQQDPLGMFVYLDDILSIVDQKHTAHGDDTTHNHSGECTACAIITALTVGEN